MSARLFLLGLGIALGSTGSYYVTQGLMQREHMLVENEQVKLLAEQVQERELQVQKLQIELDAAHAQLVIDKGTITEFTRQVAKLQDDLSRNTEELLRYESLMPSKSNTAVTIREFDAVKEGERIRFKVLLTRTQSKPAVFKGRLHFEAKGKANGKATTIVLKPETNGDSDGKNGNPKAGNSNPGLNLEFKKIERSQGLLVIPAGFVAESITIKVLEGSKVRVTRDIKLKS